MAIRQASDGAPNSKRLLSVYRQVVRLLLVQPLPLFLLMLVAFLAALCEGLSIGALVPLLQGDSGGPLLFQGVPLLDLLGQWLGQAEYRERVRTVAMIMIVLYSLRGLFLFASHRLSQVISLRVEQDLQRQAFEQMIAADLGFMHRQRLGHLLTLLNDYPAQSGRLMQTVTHALSDLLTLAIYTGLMILVSWQLMLAAGLLLLGMAGLVHWRSRFRLRRASSEANRAAASLNALGVESLSALKLIHLFSQQERVLARFRQALQEARHHRLQRGKWLALTRPLFSTGNVVVLSLLLIAGTYLIPGPSSSWMATMVLFVVIVFRMMPHASALSDARAQFGGYAPALESILDFVYVQHRPGLQNGRQQVDGIREGIAVEGVTFCYDPDEPPVLRDVTLRIPRGQTTAVVGPSGTGKTTLINLVARLYDPTAGRITVDGVDLRDLDLAGWHRQVAVVSQDTFIFHDTVSANIRFARPEASDQEVREAARLANAHGLIEALPQGYETLLGDRGVRLSGGQQQRLAIARAILANPQLLILDEATSQLDSEAELAIQQALDEISQGRTVLAVAHRLSTIRHAANIVVLWGDCVVEQGSHDDLLRRRGHYWRLVRAQNLDQNPEEEVIAA